MLLHILFPSRCVVCRAFGEVLCKNCKKSINPVLHDVCIVCNKNSKFGKTHETCKKNSHIDGALAIIKYSGAGRGWIGAIKYKRVHSAIFEVVYSFPQTWFYKFKKTTTQHPKALIVPIPLHKKRKKIRGFNQSEKIARMFSKITNMPLKNVLIRIKNTPQQAKQPTKEARRKNIKGAFTLKRGWTSIAQTVILIDDIYTSGYTAQEAAKTLKNSGVKTVLLFTLAHGKA